MTTKTLQAWVIHKQWSGDTSARVQFFTRESGLLSCLCKGGRTPKKQALLQAFTPLWLTLEERHGYYYARSIESMTPILPLKSHALFSALYINELLYHSVPTDSPEMELFDGYLTTLNGLVLAEEKAAIEALLRRFEWALLKTTGSCFSWTYEAETGLLIEPDTQYQFVAGAGFFVTRQGIRGADLLALAQDDLSDPAVLRVAKLIMRQAIDHLLGGKTIKARSLYVV